MAPPKFPLTRGLMFSLPLGATPAHIRVAITRPNASSALRILVVEDQSDLALLLAYNLEAEGYVVESVERGDEAELQLAESAPTSSSSTGCCRAPPVVPPHPPCPLQASGRPLRVMWHWGWIGATTELASVVQKAAELTLAIYPRSLWDPLLRQHAQGVSDNAWSSLRAEPKLPSW